MHFVRLLKKISLKWLLLLLALCIASASLYVSHRLSRDLAEEERVKMGIWAEAMKTLSLADSNTDMQLVLHVINANHTIPIIVTDAHGEVQFCRNLHIPQHKDSVAFVRQQTARIMKHGRCIKIPISSAGNNVMQVYYEDSVLLKRLSWYPYVNLAVAALFLLVVVYALLSDKRALQNKLWVGLSKETAHQLGTPISSLLAWGEVLQESYPHEPLLKEMRKDVERLQLVADRFSKIGSRPELVEADISQLVEGVVTYMKRRTSSSIAFSFEALQESCVGRVNATLFAWVLENLCKNAVDAIGGEPGSITLLIGKDTNYLYVEVEDSGKGIKRSDFTRVFTPGFTTKKRGWGLGLSLAKRIVESYHHGRIYVKSSIPYVRTVFRIELPI